MEWAQDDCCLGYGAGAGQRMQRHCRGADTEPDRAQAHGGVCPRAAGGLDAALRQPGVYLLVDLRADPFDQPLGQGSFVLMTQFAMRGRRGSDVLMCLHVHTPRYAATGGRSKWCSSKDSATVAPARVGWTVWPR